MEQLQGQHSAAFEVARLAKVESTIPAEQEHLVHGDMIYVSIMQFESASTQRF